MYWTPTRSPISHLCCLTIVPKKRPPGGETDRLAGSSRLGYWRFVLWNRPGPPLVCTESH